VQCSNAEAVALRDWLSDDGWKDEIFLDPQCGSLFAREGMPSARLVNVPAFGRSADSITR